MIRTCKTQCKTSCCEPFSKLVIRLNDPARSADPNTRYIDVELIESVSNSKCSNETTYVITYDENALNDPTNLLKSGEYFLICVQADFEYIVQEINAVQAPVINPQDSDSVNLNVTGDDGHTLEANVVISDEEGNSTEILGDGVHTPKVVVTSESGGDDTLGVGDDFTIAAITETDTNELNILGRALHHFVIEDGGIQISTETDAGVLIPGAVLNNFLIISNSITNPSDKLDMLVEEFFLLQEMRVNYSSNPSPEFNSEVLFTPSRSVNAGPYNNFPWGKLGRTYVRVATEGVGGSVRYDEAGPNYFNTHSLNPLDTLDIIYVVDVELGSTNNATLAELSCIAQSILKGQTIR